MLCINIQYICFFQLPNHTASVNMHVSPSWLTLGLGGSFKNAENMHGLSSGGMKRSRVLSTVPSSSLRTKIYCFLMKNLNAAETHKQ